MKKISAVFLCLTLFFIFSGCSAEKNESKTNPANTNQMLSGTATTAAIQPVQEKLLEAIAAAGIDDWDGNYKNLSFEQRTALEQYFAKTWSENVKFSDEGVVYVTNTVPLEGDWPDNEILSLAPEPDFGNVFTSSVESKAVSVSFTNVSAEVMRNYIEKVKQAGFNNVTEDYTTACCGTAFKAENTDGVTVSLLSKFFLQPVTTITVSVAGKTDTGLSEYKKISAEEAKALIDGGNTVILDVRTQEEYNGGHIKDAVLLPNTDISEKAGTVLPDKSAKILVYCRSGNRSASAAKELIEMGYTDVLDFGGIIDWPYETVT